MSMDKASTDEDQSMGKASTDEDQLMSKSFNGY